MKPTTSSTKVVSTLKGEDVEMTIDDDSISYVMDMMTNLYSDPLTASIREYTTNAHDSHIVAGVKRPVEVELPTKLNPVLVIRDFGEGLNADDIRRIYSRYGASTKRDSNKLNGVLGMGSKAALAISDTFTVVGTKDGVRTVVSVGRNEAGGGTQKILSETKVDEPNGVEITIPVSEYYRAETKAARLFRFWPKGSVLVDGAEPKKIEGGTQVTPSIRSFPKKKSEETGIDRDWIVMGNVPYPTDLDLPVYLVANVTIANGIDFDPSREGLRDTARTKKALAKVKADFENYALTTVEKAVDDAASKAEALLAYSKVSYLAPRATIQYKGKELPRTFAYPDPKPGDAPLSRRIRVLGRYSKNIYGKRDKIGRSETYTSVPLATVREAIWVVNYTNQNWAAAQRKRLEAYIEAEIEAGRLPAGTKAENALVVERPRPPLHEWVADERILDWKEIKKFKLPDHVWAGGRDKISGTYDVYLPDGSWKRKFDAKSIDQKLPIFLADEHESRLVNALKGKGTIAMVPAYRQAKFKRTFPQAQSARDAFKKVAKEWWASLNLTEKRACRYSLDHETRMVVSWFKTPAYVEDPELKEAIRARRSITKYTKLREAYSIYAWVLQKKAIEFEGIADRYPLLSTYGDADDAKSRDHALSYVNAVHYAEKGN